MESSQNIIQFADTARERVRGPPHGHAGHGFASAPSLYRALQRLRLVIQRMKAQAPGLVVEAVQTAALREDANNTRTTQAVIHDEADEYDGRRAEKLSGLTRSGTAPTQSSLYGRRNAPDRYDLGRSPIRRSSFGHRHRPWTAEFALTPTWAYPASQYAHAPILGEETATTSDAAVVAPL